MKDVKNDTKRTAYRDTDPLAAALAELERVQDELAVSKKDLAAEQRTNEKLSAQVDPRKMRSRLSRRAWSSAVVAVLAVDGIIYLETGKLWVPLLVTAAIAGVISTIAHAIAASDVRVY